MLKFKVVGFILAVLFMVTGCDAEVSSFDSRILDNKVLNEKFGSGMAGIAASSASQIADGNTSRQNIQLKVDYLMDNSIKLSKFVYGINILEYLDHSSSVEDLLEYTKSDSGILFHIGFVATLMSISYPGFDHYGVFSIGQIETIHDALEIVKLKPYSRFNTGSYTITNTGSFTMNRAIKMTINDNPYDNNGKLDECRYTEQVIYGSASGTGWNLVGLLKLTKDPQTLNIVVGHNLTTLQQLRESLAGMQETCGYYASEIAIVDQAIVQQL